MDTKQDTEWSKGYTACMKDVLRYLQLYEKPENYILGCTSDDIAENMFKYLCMHFYDSIKQKKAEEMCKLVDKYQKQYNVDSCNASAVDFVQGFINFLQAEPNT